jgi:hypothetical protein
MPSLEAPGSKKLLGRQVLTLLFGEPLEMFDNFRRLCTKRHSKILRGVELFLVSFPDKETDGVSQILQTGILPARYRLVHNSR